jgi:hypothetical protein
MEIEMEAEMRADANVNGNGNGNGGNGGKGILPGSDSMVHDRSGMVIETEPLIDELMGLGAAPPKVQHPGSGWLRTPRNLNHPPGMSH